MARRGLVLTTTGKTPVSGFSPAKARLDAAILAIARKVALEAGEDPEDVTLEPWRLHDARRTLATGLQRLGVRFEVTEAVLNHVSGAKSGIAGVYQRHDWKAEKRPPWRHGPFTASSYSIQRRRAAMSCRYGPTVHRAKRPRSAGRGQCDHG